jgi:hypothetical protein
VGVDRLHVQHSKDSKLELEWSFAIVHRQGKICVLKTDVDFGGGKMCPSLRVFAVLWVWQPAVALLAAALICGDSAFAGVGDPTIETNHPHYPGEGALQTIEQCVERATAGHKTPQEKAIALYQWLLAHQFHLQSPQEWCVPGKRPGEKPDDYEMVVYDANRGRFSYGYGLCGTVHAWNEPYWKALGMQARRRAFPGHTNSEVFYDGAWHAFDTDMAGLVFRRDGVVAGYDDIIKDPTLVDVDRSPLPRYPFAWPADFNAMKQGWQQVAKGGHWYSMYNGGYAAMPGIVHLRKGETFTRYFDPDHFGGPSKRRFWHVQKNGPQRDWTFVNSGQPRHNGAEHNARGNATYCNGEFVYKPDLSDESCREGMHDLNGNLLVGKSSPCLRSADGKPCALVCQHFSPYVICGDPADDMNPMTGEASGGLVVTGKVVGKVSLSLSASDGSVANWQLQGAFEKDLTQHVKGRYDWLLSFGFEGDSGIDELCFTTVTQVAQPIYPRLKPNGCEVVHRCASRAVRGGVLSLSATSDAPACFPETTELARRLTSKNLVHQGRSAQQRLAYLVTGNRPGQIAFPVCATAPLLEVAAAARFSVRSPTPPGCDYRLEVSTDEGKSWQPLGKADMPEDNEYSSGWMYGRADVSKANSKSAIVRAHLYGGGYQTGLIAAEMYGIYRTPPPKAAKITYAWKEAGQLKQHTEPIPAGAAEHRFQVPTGDRLVDEFVRIEAP